MKKSDNKKSKKPATAKTTKKEKARLTVDKNDLTKIKGGGGGVAVSDVVD